jgi:hypothetical protein
MAVFSHVLFTPPTLPGLSWLRQWSPNRYAANAAFLALVAADYGISSNRYRDYGTSQVRVCLSVVSIQWSPVSVFRMFEYLLDYRVSAIPG